MLTKPIREEDVPRYRIRDRGKIGRDGPRQAKPKHTLLDSTRTSEEGILPLLEVRGVVTRLQENVGVGEAYERITPVQSAAK